MAARADTGVPPLIERLRATPFVALDDGVGERAGARDGGADDAGDDAGSVDGLLPLAVPAGGFFVAVDILR